MGFEVGVIHHEHLFCPPTSFRLCTGFRLCGGSGSWGEDQLEDSLLRAGAAAVVEGFVASIGGWGIHESASRDAVPG